MCGCGIGEPGGEGAVVEVGVVPLGGFFFMCVDRPQHSNLFYIPKNKSGRIFPLRQRIDGGGGGLMRESGGDSAFRDLH